MIKHAAVLLDAVMCRVRIIGELQLGVGHAKYQFDGATDGLQALPTHSDGSIGNAAVGDLLVG